MNNFCFFEMKIHMDCELSLKRSRYLRKYKKFQPILKQDTIFLFFLLIKCFMDVGISRRYAIIQIIIIIIIRIFQKGTLPISRNKGDI